MKKILLTIALLLGSTSAVADATDSPSIVIDCSAVSATSPIKRATVISNAGYSIELRNYDDQVVLQTEVFYGDDMDVVFYYSEKADLLIEYDWSEMYQTHEATSSLTLNFENENGLRQIIPFICRNN